MAYAIGYVDNTGSEGIAHWQMLAKLKSVAEANGWTTLRYTAPTPYTDATVIRELILKGTGLSGEEEIFVGFRAFQDQSADYYNLSVACFTGYVDAATFATQPGYCENTVPAHNQRVDYWLLANAQRIAFALKIATPSYEVGYAGKFFPYATPSEYPYPMLCSGTLNGLARLRYSTTTNHYCGIHGTSNNAGSDPTYAYITGHVRSPDGRWIRFRTSPWSSNYFANPALVRPAGSDDQFTLLPAVMYDGVQLSQPTARGNTYGEPDGIRYVTGFNAHVEDTLTVDGVTHVFMQDNVKNGIGDFLAMELS